MSEQPFLAMRQSIIDGAPDMATELAQQGLASGVDPLLYFPMQKVPRTSD